VGVGSPEKSGVQVSGFYPFAIALTGIPSPGIVSMESEPLQIKLFAFIEFLKATSACRMVS
jgi:hypothetical protein